MNNRKIFHNSAVIQDLVFPIQVVTDPEKIKKYHLQKLYELSLKSLGQIPQSEEPTYDQKQWVLHKLNGSVNI